MENFWNASKIPINNIYSNLQNLGVDLFHPLIKKRNESFNKFSVKKPLSIFLVRDAIFNSSLKEPVHFDNIIKYFFNQEETQSFSNSMEKSGERERLIGKILGKIATINILESLKIENILPSQIILKKNHLGMPIIELKNAPIDFDIHVSITHKNNLNMAAAGLNIIGIDIEKKRVFSPIFIRRIFTEHEIESSINILSHLNSNGYREDKNLAYTCLFSIKEAISKALGFGLRIDFREISLFPSDSRIGIELDTFKKLDFSFNTWIYLKDDYIFTLVENVV